MNLILFILRMIIVDRIFLFNSSSNNWYQSHAPNLVVCVGDVRSPRAQRKAQGSLLSWIYKDWAVERGNHAPGASCKTCCRLTQWRGVLQVLHVRRVTSIEHMILSDDEWGRSACREARTLCLKGDKSLFSSQSAKRRNKVPVELVELSRLAVEPCFT